MSELINEEQHHAEVAALNHEIYRLTKQLNETEKERIEAETPDLYDPFGNPTEYHEYRDDYSEVLPPIKTPAYKVELEPAFDERRRLKRFYAIGGWCAALEFILTTAFGIVLELIILSALKAKNPDADASSIYTYLKGSSLLEAMNMLIYLSGNVGIALIGMKIAKIKMISLIKTRDYNVGTAINYCFCGLFIWVASAYLSMAVEDIFNQYGYTTDVMETDGVGITTLGFVMSVIYGCIIAPLTEEFFYRGFLLKVFSKANQRFGVVATAVFFGLAHRNLPQFTLAFLLGLFLAHITLKHGSIIPSIVVHMFVNSFVTIIGALDLNRGATLVVNCALFIGAILGAVLLLVFRTKDRIPATTPAQSRRGFEVARTSIGVIAAFVLQTAYTVIQIF